MAFALTREVVALFLDRRQYMHRRTSLDYLVAVGIRAGAFYERKREAWLQKVIVQEIFRAVRLASYKTPLATRSFGFLILTHTTDDLELTFAVIDFSTV